MIKLFNQPRGLGDIMFLMAIAQNYAKLGHEIYWPIEKRYLNIAKHFPEISFVDYKRSKFDAGDKEIWERDGVHHIPFRFADELMGVPYYECMPSKYWFHNDQIAQRPEEIVLDWRNFNIVRDVRSEAALFKKILGVSYADFEKSPFDFVVINRRFRTSQTGVAEVTYEGAARVIELREVLGFTLIDWSSILLKAAEIRTVSTSINYLIEALPITCPIHLYLRKPDEVDFKTIEAILDFEKYEYYLHD
jgi:hypothetical protein